MELAAAVQPRAVNPHIAATAEAFTRPSILCVESDIAWRDRFAADLHEYACVFAKNASEAVRNLHARSFDGYLLDYWMPDWSGPLLCREIRKWDPNTPIVFCTESTRDLRENRALPAGATAYVCKALDADSVSSKFRALFERCESNGLSAMDAAERALNAELERHMQSREGRPVCLTAGRTPASVEPIARARAYRAFIDAGGTRAHFERWWPQVFSNTVS